MMIKEREVILRELDGRNNLSMEISHIELVALNLFFNIIFYFGLYILMLAIVMISSIP